MIHHRIVGTTIVGLFVASTFLLGACQLRGGAPASKTYLITLDADDFDVFERPETTFAIADHKVAITAADVKDAVITAQLQTERQDTWGPFPYTNHGFIPDSEPKRSASLTLTYEVREGHVRLIATADLTGAEMAGALRVFNGFKIRIRVVPTRV